MISDVSYGVGETVTETDLVAGRATARYLVPTSADRWVRRRGPAGRTTIPSGRWARRAWGSHRSRFCDHALPGQHHVDSVSAAQRSSARRPSRLRRPANGDRAEFHGHGRGRPLQQRRHRPRQYCRLSFPGMTVDRVTTTSCRPRARSRSATSRYYTFGVNSDDGFSLNIAGREFRHGLNYTTCSGSTLASDKCDGQATLSARPTWRPGPTRSPWCTFRTRAARA